MIGHDVVWNKYMTLRRRNDQGFILNDEQIMWDTRLGDFTKLLNLMNSLNAGIRLTSESSNDR